MKKRLVVLGASLLLTMSLAGCSNGAQANTNQADYIGVDAAKNAALTTAQVASADATFSVAELKERNGSSYYDVTFTANGKDYYYAIDAMTGTVIESSSVDGNNQQTAAPSVETAGQIDEAVAKQTALEHAGVAESDTAFLRVTQDYDDGVQVFDVEFYVAATNSEYDYEISASTGEILSFDQDAEGYNPNQSGNVAGNTAGTTKTEAEIQEIALAKVPGATKDDIRLKLDRDDGRLLYEGTIVYEEMKYDFEIDAYSGAVLEWEAESVFD